MAWYSDWTYRKVITIDNMSEAEDLTDYQVRVTVPYSTRMLVNFNDIRFTDSDGETLLDFWKEMYFGSSNAYFWVKVPSITGNSFKTIYMYYGKVGALDASSDSDTFIVGADFNDASLTGLTINTAGSAIVEVPTISGEEVYGLYLNNFAKCLNPVLPYRVGKWDAHSTRELCPVTWDDTGKIVKDANNKITAYHWGKATVAGTRAIGIATSTDEGFTWGERLDSPVISPSGTPGSWYRYHIETPCVLKRRSDNLLMMLATGEAVDGDPDSRTIGGFSSEDGTTWSDEGSMIDPADYNFSVGVPCTKCGVPTVIKRQSNGDYICLFEGSAGAAWKIFGATSSSFFGTWTPLNSGNSVFSVGVGGQWDDYTVANPRLIELDENEFLIAYNGQQNGGDWSVGFAYSSNLLNWTRYATNPVIGPSVSGWDSSDTETSFLVKDDDSSHLRFFYQGFEGNVLQVGLALCEQGRRIEARSTAEADGWVIGKDLDGITTFKFEFTSRELYYASIAGDTTYGIEDYASVPNPMVNTSWNPIKRVSVARYSPADGNANKFYIQYITPGDVNMYWTGVTWDAAKTYFGAAGPYKIRFIDDGTNYKIDILDVYSGTSILANIASIAKSSVKDFSAGRVALVAEGMTSHFYQGQSFDNFIVREYASVEPSASLGSEEMIEIPDSGVAIQGEFGYWGW